MHCAEQYYQKLWFVQLSKKALAEFCMLGYCPIPVDLSLLDEEDEYQAVAQEVLNLSKQ